MYAAHFRLKREPFSIAPDPHFLFMSEAHREALAHLLYGVSGGGGFVLLTGEIGAGKTTVCRCFLDQVPADSNVAYIFNPKLEVIELLQTVCEEFGIERPAAAATVKEYVDRLNAFLLQQHAAGRNSVLIIDEAQSLSPAVLEQLRLLTNLETAERKLLQIILIGQPELRDMLARPRMEQMAQRVIARYHLPALSAAETVNYIRHRMAVAGLDGEVPFDERALARIHQLAGGVPRRINLLADRALLGAYANRKARVDREIVEKAAAEVFDAGRRSAPPAAPSRKAAAAKGGGLVNGVLTAALALAGAIGLVVAVAYWPTRPAARAVAAEAASAASAAAAAAAVASAASAAQAAAAAASATAAATVADDLGALATAVLRSEPAAWQELAALWKAELPAGEPCEQALRVQLACFRGSGGAAALRDLGRPALLLLRDAQGQPGWVIVTALGDGSLALRAGKVTQTVTPAALGGAWRGEFATLWRTPPGWRDAPGEAPAPALAAWMSERLPGRPTVPLKTRITAFQVAQGLKADGLAGPMTLMQLNRAGGVDEPRLGP